MVSAAKMKEISSEKCLKEAQMQMDGLQAEVTALKALLITSTPSRPNLGGIAGNANSSNGISIFKKQHKRYPSHNQLQYGRTETETEKEYALINYYYFLVLRKTWMKFNSLLL